MKINQLKAATQKLKNAGIITSIGLLSLFAPRGASAQNAPAVGEEFTVHVHGTDIQGGAAMGYKHTRVGLANIFGKVYPMVAGMPTMVDNQEQEILVRIDSLVNGYLVKTYYEGEKRQQLLSGAYTKPNNCVLESAQNEVLMENIQTMDILMSADNKQINGFMIASSRKPNKPAAYCYYDKDLNLIYNAKTRKGNYKLAEKMVSENQEARDNIDKQVMNNPALQAQIQAMKNANQKWVY